MLRRLLFGRPWLGLDIQSHAINFVEFNRRTKSIRKKASITSPEALLVENKISNWPLLTNLLSNLVTTYQLTNYQVVTSLPISQVQMQTMQVPMGMTHAAIENEIDRQTAVEFPWLQGTLCKDYNLVLHSNTVDWNINFVVAHKESIDALAQSFSQVGLALKIIDVDILAICRINQYLLNRQYGVSNYLLLYVAHDVIHLMAWKDKQLLHREQWATNTSEWIDKMSQYIEWNLSQYREASIETVSVCGLNQNVTKVPAEIFNRYGLNVFHPTLPIEDKYWLAYGLAMHGGCYV